ncbi:hypothetical protein [uncultured Tessaracoccus sp.]|uniref:hypothetical protein n=1 Tax=uncultured Tessaracoccus sp. TaxID=905023 RepID=UPI00261A8C6C|nr:hypothetical protein [uncultured Tessaracoccus sp.]
MTVVTWRECTEPQMSVEFCDGRLTTLILSRHALEHCQYSGEAMSALLLPLLQAGVLQHCTDLIQDAHVADARLMNKDRAVCLQFLEQMTPAPVLTVESASSSIISANNESISVKVVEGVPTELQIADHLVRVDAGINLEQALKLVINQALDEDEELAMGAIRSVEFQPTQSSDWASLAQRIREYRKAEFR